MKPFYDKNELYEFDESNPSIYSPECVKRDLKVVLLEKFDGNTRAHIDEGVSLTYFYNRYFRLKQHKG